MNTVDSRKQILIRTSWISMVGNTILSLAKIIVGIISGSLAVLSDGIDSATDVIISIVMLFTARIMSKPPSKKYVFGYEKAESIATKILSLIIFYAGMHMLITSAESLFSYETKAMPSIIAVYVTAISIVGKILLALYQYRQGRKADSPMLKANAVNMRNDVIISIGVLLGLIFTFTLKLPILDSITGLLISIFIIKSSISIFMDSSIELMDGVKDITVYKKIFHAVEEIPQASNPHRVRSRLLGHMYVISLDIEVDGSLSLKEAHRIAEDVDLSIRNSVENVYDITIHVEPKGVNHPDNERFGLDKNIIY